MSVAIIKDIIISKSEGTATVLTIDSGFNVYTLALNNHPINQEEFGDKMTSDCPYIDEGGDQEGHISMIEMCKNTGFSTAEQYEQYIQQFTILKHTTTQPIRVLYVPTESAYFTVDEREQIRNALNIQGTLQRYQGLMFMSLFDNAPTNVTILEHPPLEDYLSAQSISDTDIIETTVQSILNKSILTEVPISEV